ncbi:MAG: hypothetical protein QM426_03875 [Euryarchaeota archaeon]|nr:hypothetical protein [Euryarchaeota archaeon]
MGFFIAVQTSTADYLYARKLGKAEIIQEKGIEVKKDRAQREEGLQRKKGVHEEKLECQVGLMLMHQYFFLCFVIHSQAGFKHPPSEVFRSTTLGVL